MAPPNPPLDPAPTAPPPPLDPPAPHPTPAGSWVCPRSTPPLPRSLSSRLIAARCRDNVLNASTEQWVEQGQTGLTAAASRVTSPRQPGFTLGRSATRFRVLLDGLLEK